MIDDRLEKLAAAYVLGTLNPVERAELEGKMAGNSELSERIARFRALFKPGAPVSRNPEALPTVLATLWLPWALSAGLAVLCAIAATQNKTLHDRLARKTADLYAADSLNHALMAKHEALGQVIAAVEAPNGISTNSAWANLQITMLDPLSAEFVKAGAVTLWNNTAQEGVLIVEAMPALAVGQEYQLWIFNSAQQSVKAATFQVDANGAGRLEFKPAGSIKNAAKFEVALVAAGDTQPPTSSKIILAGQ